MTTFVMFQRELSRPFSIGWASVFCWTFRQKAPLHKAHGARCTGPLRSLPRCRHPLMSSILINSFGLGAMMIWEISKTKNSDHFESGQITKIPKPEQLSRNWRHDSPGEQKLIPSMGDAPKTSLTPGENWHVVPTPGSYAKTLHLAHCVSLLRRHPKMSRS